MSELFSDSPDPLSLNYPAPSGTVQVSETPYPKGNLGNISSLDIPERIGANERSDIWTRAGYVSIEKYQTFSSKTDQQKTVRISAIVQPIFQASTINFGFTGYTFGCNEKPTQETCGKVRAIITCSADPNHPSYYKLERCNEPLCPVCYPKFAGRIADAVTERITGYRSVFGYDPIYHLVFWPEFRDGYRTLKEAFAAAKERLSALGVIAAVVWYHPYRIINAIKERLRHYRRVNRLPASVGFWQMAHDDVLNLGSLKEYIREGPHWHAIATGYLENVVTYADKRIGGYKKVRYLDSETEVRKVGYYLSTHACREATKSTVRYYGKISYSKLSKGEPVEKIEDVVCDICGKHLQEHHCLDTGEVTGLSKEKITRKIITFKYWKRGTKKKVLRQAGLSEHAVNIWGPAGPPGRVSL